MAYQHYNRLLDHWTPKIRPEGEILAFRSTKRHRSLTASAVAVAQFITGHLNQGSNCYEISQKTMSRQLGLAKGTIGKALDELVEWGVFTREREHKEKPYLYRLAIECPADCERLEHHQTPSEQATLPKNQATPTPKEQETSTPKKQATRSLRNRQLIERDKEINKEMDRPRASCFECSGDYEQLPNGNQEVIHSMDCPQLLKLKQTQAWNITKTQTGSAWDSLSCEEQQVANYLSLSKGKERVARKAEQDQFASQESRAKFQKVISRTLAENNLEAYNPLILDWLEIVHSQGRELSDTHIKRAVEYTNKGWTLKPEGDWRSGLMITKDHFLESELF
jgi:hypothetical protein